AGGAWGSLLRQPAVPRRGRADRRRGEAAAHPGGDRPGPLRPGLPADQRRRSVARLAGGQADHGPRRRPFGDGARHPRPAGGRAGALQDDRRMTMATRPRRLPTAVGAATDRRPPMAVAHVFLPTTVVGAAAAWLEAIGLRPIFAGDELAILELRGGTHVIVTPAEAAPARGSEAPFDLMVDDVAATR